MNQNNVLKYLVPIVAIVVLVESVVLISRMNDKGVTPKSPDAQMDQVDKPDTVMVEDVKTGDEVFDISIAGDKAEMVVGESGKISVKMVGSVDKAVDSINVYVKYDPKTVEVGDLVFDERLPAPAFSKVSTLRGLLVANFLISDPAGLQLASGDELELMSFDMKALEPGDQTFEISTGKEMKESATMIVENGTSQPLSFFSNKLTVKVTE